MKNWDWDKMIPGFDYHKLAVLDWPGWDKINEGCPAYVQFVCVKGNGQSSREVAIEFDDMAEGQFYYRDFTNSGLPFVEKNESYRSLFVFQRFSDFEKFKNHFKLISILE